MTYWYARREKQMCNKEFYMRSSHETMYILPYLNSKINIISYFVICFRLPLFQFCITYSQTTIPVDTGRKLNVHATIRRRPGRLLNVLCTFNLRPVSKG